VLGGFHQKDSMRRTMLADARRRVKLRRARQAPTTRSAAASQKRMRYFESLSVGAPCFSKGSWTSVQPKRHRYLQRALVQELFLDTNRRTLK
jgi:hypothetical protein